MKFRIFLGIVCLAFIAALLAYGSNAFGTGDEVAAIPTVEPTPIIIASLPESDSCGGNEVVFDDRPLVAGIVGRPTSLLPVSTTPRSPIEVELSSLIFRGLVRFTPNGEPVPDLASWQVSEDGLSITFTLDQGGMWHDGTPVTAADVAFTAGLLASGGLNVPGNFPWNTVTTTIVDNATVQVNLPIPFTPFLEAATVGLLPAHLGLNGQNLAGSDFAARPIGTGNFQVANNWQSDGVVFLQSATPGILDSLEFRFYRSIDDISVDLKSGSLDLAVLPNNMSIVALGAFSTDQLNTFSGPADQITQLLFRMDADETAPISDPAVRQALRLVLDRQAVIDQAASGQGLLTEGPWDINSRYQDETLFRFVKTDLDRAETLLAEAGWVLPEEGAPIYQKDGVDLAINLLVSNQGNYSAIAAELQKQWGDFGILVNVETAPPAAYQTALANRQFDGTVQKVNITQDPDLYDFWSQEAIVRGQNVAKWNHRPSSEALEAGRQVWDFELRKPYYNAFRSFYEKELPAFTLYQDVRSLALNGNVGGQMVGAPGDLVEFLTPFQQWYILDHDAFADCEES